MYRLYCCKLVFSFQSISWNTKPFPQFLNHVHNFQYSYVHTHCFSFLFNYYMLLFLYPPQPAPSPYNRCPLQTCFESSSFTVWPWQCCQSIDEYAFCNSTLAFQSVVLNPKKFEMISEVSWSSCFNLRHCVHVIESNVMFHGLKTFWWKVDSLTNACS